MEATDTTASPPSTGQDHSKRRILSGLGEVFTSTFIGCNSGGYSKTNIDKIKKKIAYFTRISKLAKLTDSR